MNYRTAYKLRKIQALTQDPVLVALWGLILAKCCFLEHFVRQHGVPVNTIFYIWSLSLLMAAAATFVLSGLVEPKVFPRDAPPDGPWLWPVILITMILLLAGALLLGNGTVFAVLPVLCLPPGTALAIRSSIRFHLSTSLQSAGWIVSAAFLALVPPPARLLPLSIILLLLVVLPGVLRFIHNRRQIRLAMQALQK